MKTIYKNITVASRNVASALRGRLSVATAGVAGIAASGMASAQDGLGAKALAQVSGISADVAAILGTLVIVVFGLVAWGYFKRVK
ncbi:hypothetical protein [Stenotrophomonas sp.]|uniref:hypothetical protein n=1 Tax=Stenotrophomonas sp. TaxID=69392 RepID=UPI0028AE07D3|nr:hypothetical protein [Stenotrophomonas sp.]